MFNTQGNSTYTVDGTVNVQDRQTGVSSTMVGTGVTRSSSCCRPTDGTVQVTTTGGRYAGQHTWTFGPSCLAGTYNDQDVTLPDCL